METTITIRPARDAERPALCRMANAMVDEGCCNGMVPDAPEDWAARDNITVAEADGEIVGFAYGSVGKSHMRKAGVCQKGDAFYELEELYVIPERRDKGTGRLLFQAQEDIARGLGCTSLQLAAVSRDHARLIRFYESVGMEFWSAWLCKPLI